MGYSGTRMHEFDLIAGLASRLDRDGPGVLVGHGDDAAVLDGGLVVAIDAIVEDVHFRRRLSSPQDIGWKAIAVNVSDLAAMGAAPTAAVMALARPADLTVADINACYDGMREAADRWGLSLVGGDTVRAPAWMLAVTALGRLDRAPVTRGGARAGDAVVVVGALGAAAAGLQGLEAGREVPPELAEAHRRPRALPAAGALLAAAGATAMIDVSDGLGADLRHLCEASGVGMRVDLAALPVADGVPALVTPGELWRVVCGGGEDFALAACVPSAAAEAAAAQAAAAEAGVAWAVIGEVVPAPARGPLVTAALPGGGRLALDRFGYDHGT